MTPSLLVIVPSRGRPHTVAEMVEAWQATDTGSEAALLFGVDADDPHLPAYQDAVQAAQGFPFAVSLRVGPRLRMVGTLNEIAVENVDTAPCVGFLGDDHRPRTAGWSHHVLAGLRGGEDGPWVVYGDDGFQHEEVPTACFFTSDMVRVLGYFAPNVFVHLEADRVWKQWGETIDRLVYLPDVFIEHCHPHAGKGVWDAGYADVNSDAVWEADRAANATYHADGSFAADIAKLRGLIR